VRRECEGERWVRPRRQLLQGGAEEWFSQDCISLLAHVDTKVVNRGLGSSIGWNARRIPRVSSGGGRLRRNEWRATGSQGPIYDFAGEVDMVPLTLCHMPLRMAFTCESH